MKRTIYIGNPAYLSLKQERLRLTRPDDQLFEKLIPIEDVGVLVLDHQQITTTQALHQALMAQEVAVIVCDDSHMPSGLMLPLAGHTLHQVRLRGQVESSLPLRKQLWRQTIQAKIRNQAALLGGEEAEPMRLWASRVKSGDPDNLEGRAAAWYWQHLLFRPYGVRRDAEGDFPNALLNYGYAILRALVARALVSGGLHPALGIHHRNQYNPFALADDMMEPYRPYVDLLVLKALEQRPKDEGPFLTLTDKKWLLQLPVVGVPMVSDTLPLSYALTRSVSSLAKAYAGEEKKLVLPQGTGVLDAIGI